MYKLIKLFYARSLLQSVNTNHSEHIAVLKSKTGIALVLLTIIFLVSFGYLVSFTSPYLSRQSSLFNVDARTEFVSIAPFDETRYPQWRLNHVHLYNGCDDRRKTVTGDLNILPTTTIDIERIAKGDLTVTLNSPNFEDTAVILLDDNSEITLSDCAILRFNTINQSYIFPIDGTITLGHQISENNTRPPVLKSGTIYVADKRILADDYYQNSPFKLRIGDRFQVREPQTQASGFIYADDKGEMDISYRVKGKTGVIQKYKSEPILVANSFWSKLVNDDLLAIFWFFLLTLLSTIKSLFFLKLNSNTQPKKISPQTHKEKLLQQEQI